MKIHCLRCGSILGKRNKNELPCSNCGYKFYINPFPTTSVVIVNDKNEIMLVKRKFDPKKGFWDLPGGFIDINESGEECTKREIKEELGIILNKVFYIGSYPDKYFFQETKNDTLAISYYSKMPKQEIKVSDDIDGYKFFNPKDIPFEKLAFVNLSQTINDFLKIKKLF